jgi:hypothetical protein
MFSWRHDLIGLHFVLLVLTDCGFVQGKFTPDPRSREEGLTPV